MAGTSTQHEKMPNRMVERQAFPHVKRNAKGIEETSCKQPGDHPQWQHLEHGLNGNDRQPPHGDIKRHSKVAEHFRLIPQNGLYDDSADAMAQIALKRAQPQGPRMSTSIIGVYVPAINKKIAE